MPNHRSLFIGVIICTFFAVASRGADGSGSMDLHHRVDAAAKSITDTAILNHVRILSSDQFGGRDTGKEFEDLSVQYISKQLAAIGLKPIAPGSDLPYVQKVPLVCSTADYQASYSTDGTNASLAKNDDLVAYTLQSGAQVSVKDSDIIFVGYGVQAPEFNWDDYAGLDVQGKTLLMLVNDPQVVDPADPTRLDSSYFGGQAMTYYGRWTYKYAIAAQLGARAAIIIHETGPAGYPYSVVQASFGLSNCGSKANGDPAPELPVRAWMALDAAKALLAKSGLDYGKLKDAANKKGFKPIALKSKFNITLTQSPTEVNSKNVVGILEGSDPTLKSQYVVYSAHWDHLGTNPNLPGDDKIYNGAADNAAGVGVILEIARAFANMETKPKASMLFLFTTGEEKNLLGSLYYSQNPLVAPVDTLADLNIDTPNVYGTTRDIAIRGFGKTTLEDILAQAATSRGRVAVPESDPENGSFYRSDQFAFAKIGVPCLFTAFGVDTLDKTKPAGYGKTKHDNFWANIYHHVNDQIGDDWDLSGAIADALLLMDVGLNVADGVSIPKWKEGSEFKAIREASLKSAGRDPSSKLITAKKKTKKKSTKQ